MDPHFLLTFGTTLGKTRTLRVNNASTTVSDASIRGAMGTMMSSQAVAGASGRIVVARRAALVQTHVTPIDLAL